MLWLTKGLGPGGAERLLVTHAAAADPEVVTYESAYLLPHKTQLVAELEAAGVVTHGLDSPRDLDPRWLARFRRLVTERDIDVVHAHSPAPAALARVALRSLPARSRPAFVYTEHNRWPSHGRVTRAANAATFGLNDATIAVSEDVRASLPTSRRAGVQVIVHGIDVEAVHRLAAERDQVRAELDLAPETVVAITVANFRAPKGYPDLLAAARRVIDADPRVTFLVVGQGPQADEIEAEHRRLGLGDRVRILGYRPDAPRLTAAADLFVLASLHEGIPVAVMEAFAAGVPVVATRVGGLAEVVEPDVSGRLVPPRRPDLLAGAVLDLATDERHPAAAGCRGPGGRAAVLGGPVRGRGRAGLPAGAGPGGHAQRAGTPTAVTSAGTSRSTTAPAPTTDQGPIRRPGVTTAPVPNRAPSPTCTPPLTSTPGLKVAWSSTTESCDTTAFTLICT